MLLSTSSPPGTHALPHVQTGLKNEVAVMVLSFAPQQLMAKILRRNLTDIIDAVNELQVGKQIFILTKGSL